MTCLGSRPVDCLRCRGRSEPSSLGSRKHRPADLVDLLALPLSFPVADPSGYLTAFLADDLVLAGTPR